MPDIAATGQSTVFLIIVGDFNTVQNPFRCRNLIRPHDHQHVLGSEDAVLGQDIQDRVPRKKGPGEVDQIRDHPVIGIGPEAGELEAVAGLLLLLLAGLCILDGIEPGAVGVILGVRAITDDEDLNILKQTTSCPEGIPLIPVDLVERLPDNHTTPFQFHMNHREAIDQDRHIIAVAVPCSLVLADSILIDDLKEIVMDVFLVDQGDVFGRTIITLLGIGEGIAVQHLQFIPEICNQLCLRMDRKIFIALPGEHTDEFPLQFSFALIAVGPGLHRLIFCDNSVFRCLGDDIEVRHSPTSLFVS